MAVRASRTSSSLNGLMIAITIFMGLGPRLGPGRTDRAFSTEVHHAEMFTTRAQPGPLESNAVPDRSRSLTDYESGSFRPLRELHVPAPFGRAQSVVRIAQIVGSAERRQKSLLRGRARSGNGVGELLQRHTHQLEQHKGDA